MLCPYLAKLQTTYIFSVIEKKLAEAQKAQPNQKVFNLGVGDIALPLSPTIAKAICNATMEMANNPRGYGPSGGYPFLKNVICENEYALFGITQDEIFISNGANPDASSIQEIFAKDTTILVTDPSYPVYREASLISGKKTTSLSLQENEGFIPLPPKERFDLVYLCSPSNPTGIAMDRKSLSKWVEWAKKNRSLLIIDNVYQAFITSSEIPASIYEIPGAHEVAIEIRSFSKWAGFTGLRCGYMVVPKTLHVQGIHDHWAKRVDIKTNGVAYPMQKGAEAAYSPQAKKEIAIQLETYRQSANILSATLHQIDQTYYGGIDAPYIFWKTPKGMNSWTFFDTLLKQSKIITIPGKGFGPSGEGFVRLSCFISPTLAQEAAHAILHHFRTN